MELYLSIIFGLIGAAVGSFINVCADRLPAGKSLLAPPSHCDGCQRRLSPLELIPVFSFLFLRGRCRSCGAVIPVRVMLVELGCGIFTALVFHYTGLVPRLGFILVFSYIFIVIALIDLNTRLILNKIVFPSLLLALVSVPFFVGTGIEFKNITEFGIINALIGAAAGFIILLIPAIVMPGGMGFGDVKLAALIGMITGFAQVLVAVLGGIILGGLAAIFLLIFRIKKRKEAIPFGPFLSLATIVTLIWGSEILDWYLRIFTG